MWAVSSQGAIELWISLERPTCASSDALRTEAAPAGGEVQERESRVADTENTLRAGTDAVAAAVAGTAKADSGTDQGGRAEASVPRRSPRKSCLREICAPAVSAKNELLKYRGLRECTARPIVLTKIKFAPPPA